MSFISTVIDWVNAKFPTRTKVAEPVVTVVPTLPIVDAEVRPKKPRKPRTPKVKADK